MADLKNKPWIRDLWQIQIGNLSDLFILPRTELTFTQQLLDNIDRVSKAHHQGKDNKTVFDEILDSRLSEEDKQPLRLLQEAQNFSIAGTETTSWILSVRQIRNGVVPFHPMRADCQPQIMTVHLLSNPRVLGKLRTELKAALVDVDAPLSIKDIEQLPYLGAIITEGLRLAMGTSQRQTRISPTDVMTFNDGKKQWRIPPGVSIPPSPSPSLPPIPSNKIPHTGVNIPTLKLCIHRPPSAWPPPSST